MENKEKRVSVAFASINKTIESNIVSPKEYATRGANYVSWGKANNYPDYLTELVKDCPTLHSIITGNVDFILGDAVTLDFAYNGKAGVVNRDGMTDYEFIKALATDEEYFGGCAFEVVRDMTGEPAELRPLDLRYLRMNEDRTVFFYNEKFGNSYVRSGDTIMLPAFNPEDRSVARSVVFLCNAVKSVYPSPKYGAAVKACEIERNVTEYHINALENGFAGSYIVNFNNGKPTDKEKDQIENDFNEKYCGSDNAGRVIFSFNDSQATATTLERMDVTDFGEKYKSLADHSRQQIFVAFRACPALFGLMTESTGFSTQEFSEAFKLYNRTQIRPIQRAFVETMERVMGRKGVLNIKPFSIEGDNETNIA